jgi:photosystem II stability/assembly factor-like uncharacterized protein
LNSFPLDSANGLTPAVRQLALITLCTFTVTAGAELARSVDHRAIAAPLVERSLLLDGDAIGDHMVVVGERGHILVSVDAGMHWTQADVPTRATLTGVHLHDPARAWAVGHDATILRSSDGGLTWETVFSAPQEQRPLLDVWFENAEHGFAVGAYGYFLESHDGGDTWEHRSIIGDDRHLNHITGSSSKRLYITGEAGVLLRSDNGGADWQALPSPYDGSLFGTLPLEGKRVYVFGLRGHLYTSDDAGVSWQPVTTGTQNLITAGIRIGGDGILFTGMGGIVLRGDASGAGVRSYLRTDHLGISGALAAADGTLVVFGEFGVQRITDDQLEPLR